MTFLSRSAFAVVLVLIIQLAVLGGERTHREGETEITYDQIADEYAIAIAKIVESARTIARADYGYHMPVGIRVSVISDSKSQTRLFNDGRTTSL